MKSEWNNTGLQIFFLMTLFKLICPTEKRIAITQVSDMKGTKDYRVLLTPWQQRGHH